MLNRPNFWVVQVKPDCLINFSFLVIQHLVAYSKKCTLFCLQKKMLDYWHHKKYRNAWWHQ